MDELRTDEELQEMNMSLFEGTEELEQNKALQLHNEIMTSATMAASNLIDMCASLKKMRDEKLFKALGHETFDDYCENRAGFKSRQAYSYIQAYETLPKEFLQSNAKLGITKLSLIAQLPAHEVEDFIEANDVEDMSTRELKRLIEENKKLEEQLSLFQERVDYEKADEKRHTDRVASQLREENEELQDKYDAQGVIIANLQEQIKSLQEQKPEENNADLQEMEEKNKEIMESYKAGEKRRTETAVKKALEKAKKEAEEEAEANKQKELENVEEKYQAEIESLKQAAMLNEERTKALENKLKLSDGNSAVFKTFFTAIQEDWSKMLDAFNSMPSDVKPNMYNAVDSLLENFKKMLENTKSHD